MDSKTNKVLEDLKKLPTHDLNTNPSSWHAKLMSSDPEKMVGIREICLEWKSGTQWVRERLPTMVSLAKYIQKLGVKTSTKAVSDYLGKLNGEKQSHGSTEGLTKRKGVKESRVK